MTDRYDIISEQIYLLLGGGDASEDSTLDRREIRLLVEQSHSPAIRNNYFENLRNVGQHGVSGAFKTTLVKLPVKKDLDRQESYLDLPHSYINLPGEKGVDEVWEWNNPKAKPIMKVPSGYNALFSGLRFADLAGHFGYYTEGQKIFFANKTDRAFTVPFMNVRLVHGSGNSISQDQELAIIAEVTKLLATGRRPQDKQNDGNPLPV